MAPSRECCPNTSLSRERHHDASLLRERGPSTSLLRERRPSTSLFEGFGQPFRGSAARTLGERRPSASLRGSATQTLPFSRGSGGGVHFPFRGVRAAPERFLLRERRPEQLPLCGALPERFPLLAMWHNVELVVVRRADAARSVVGGLCGPPAWSARLHSIFSRSELACERPRESANVRPRGRGQLRPELAHVRPRGRGLLRPELARIRPRESACVRPRGRRSAPAMRRRPSSRSGGALICRFR